ncbi:MAG: EAL domain-containing protein [Chromatiales bacterium]|nr:EAL domain-containing protein [Chromatiales bacterium]
MSPGPIDPVRQALAHSAIDEFSSGLSSFAYLCTLKVEYFEIEGALVRSVNDIGKVMGKQPVAGWVEVEATLAKLRELGVDYAQGYFVGRASPIEAMHGSR